jgi:hypothetical protein
LVLRLSELPADLFWVLVRNLLAICGASARRSFTSHSPNNRKTVASLRHGDDRAATRPGQITNWSTDAIGTMDVCPLDAFFFFAMQLRRWQQPWASTSTAVGANVQHNYRGIPGGDAHFSEQTDRQRRPSEFIHCEAKPSRRIESQRQHWRDQWNSGESGDRWKLRGDRVECRR